MGGLTGIEFPLALDCAVLPLALFTLDGPVGGLLGMASVPEIHFTP